MKEAPVQSNAKQQSRKKRTAYNRLTSETDGTQRFFFFFFFFIIIIGRDFFSVFFRSRCRRRLIFSLRRCIVS